MNVERTYRWTRMPHSGVQFSLTAALPPSLFLADCIINIAEFEFSIGTGGRVTELVKQIYSSFAAELFVSMSSNRAGPRGT